MLKGRLSAASANSAPQRFNGLTEEKVKMVEECNGDSKARCLTTWKVSAAMACRTYLEDLEALVPAYIPALPSARCFAPYQWFGGSDSYQRFHWSSLWTDGEFRLHKCPTEKVTLLIVPSVLFDFIQRYNLMTGNWSRTSLLDGTCTFVR